MSLSSALNIGRTALAVNQAALQTVGNNIANVGNPNYTRQTTSLSTANDLQVGNGQFIGQGVNLDGISRQIDEALQGRLRNAGSDNENANAQQQWLGRVESVFNELTDQDLSSQLSKFFNSWSDLANKPQDPGLRQIVLQNGDTVAKWFQNIRGQLSSLQNDADSRLKALADTADGLSQKIADLNVEIVRSEGGGTSGGQANGLRDQRDADLKSLSELMDIHTVEQPSGSVNVYVGSQPLVMDGRNIGVTTLQQTEDGVVKTKVVFKDTNGEIPITSGQIGGLVQARAAIDDTANQVDTLAGSLIFELNKIHSSGQGLEGFATVTGSTTISDSTVALNNEKTGLKQFPSNGSFVVHVKNKLNGTETSTLIKVDLNGSPTDTTLDSLVANLDGIDGITARNVSGRLQITADNSPASEITFSQDSSGALAALGVNTFFSGKDANTIAVSNVIKSNTALLAAGKNGDSGDNQTAVAIAKLETTSVASLKGATLNGSYESLINTISTQTSAATSNADASKSILETLQAQRESLSGVDMDEEAVNMIRYQRAFQGAAKLVTVVDEMMQTMLNLVT